MILLIQINYNDTKKTNLEKRKWERIGTGEMNEGAPAPPQTHKLMI